MAGKTNNTWLFAFTDLSFLLLIGLSTIPSASGDISLHLAEMRLPVVPDSQTLQPLRSTEDVWELQILPAAGEGAPFRLRRAGEREGMACTEENLLPALEELHRQGRQPILLPDKGSFSQDFLYAAGALARVWSMPNSPVIVQPKPAGGGE